MRRFLAGEQLEDRMLLAGDLFYHNQALAADVNGDGEVNLHDAFAVIQQLRASGPIALTSSQSFQADTQTSTSTSGAEGEGATTAYVDVDGDNYLSLQDALQVVQVMRAESGPTDDVNFILQAVNATARSDFNGSGTVVRFDATGPGDAFAIQFLPGAATGAPTIADVGVIQITLNGATADELVAAINNPANGIAGRVTASVESGPGTTQLNTTATAFFQVTLRAQTATVQQGDSFYFNVFAQDNRDVSVGDRGVLAFTMDVAFDNSRVIAQPPLDDSPTFNNYTNATVFGEGADNATGLINNLSILTLQTAPYGGNPVLATAYTYVADALRPGNDLFNSGVDSTGTPLLEDGATPFVLNVLANDNLFNNAHSSGGVANFTGQDEPTGDILVGSVSAPVTITDHSKVDYGSASVTVTGGAATLVSVQGTTANNGSAVIDTMGDSDPANDRVLYTPATNFSGTDTFTYLISDGGDITKTATVTVSVAAVNDPPMIDPIGNQMVDEDSGSHTVNLTGISAGGAGTESQPLSVTVVGNTNSSLFSSTSVSYTTPAATGTFNYTLAADQSGTAAITLQVEDGGFDGNLGTTGDNASTTVTFNIAVNEINDPPIPVSVSRSTSEDTPATGQSLPVLVAEILAAAPGPASESGQTVSVAQINDAGSPSTPIVDPATQNGTHSVTGSAGGTLTINFDAGTYDYAPAQDFAGEEYFTYILQDDGGTALGGVDTATGTVTVSVSAVNDPPEVSLDDNNSNGNAPNFQTTFTEDVTGPVAIGDVDALVSDVDNANLASLTITLGSAPDGTAESLTFSTAGTSISGTFTPGTGVLALTGSDTLAHYTDVLRSVRYDNASNNPTLGARMITVVANDGSADGNTATAIVTVQSANDAPTLTGVEAAALDYDENQAPTQISGAITAADVDDTMLEGAVVQITGNYQNGQDVLGLLGPLPAGINVVGGAFDAGSGSITLTGSASVADYQAALRTIAYSNSSEDPSALPRTVSFTVNDGDVGSNIATRAINVVPINDAPTLDPIGNPTAIDEDAAQQTVNLSGIGAGGEVQNLTVTAVSDNTGLIPNPGVTYTPNAATGMLSYTPVADASGTAVITVTVMDDGGTSNGGVNMFQQSFTVTVNPVNDAPTLNAIGDVIVNEDAPQQMVGLAGISAGGGETQNLTITAQSDNPTLIADPTVTYTSDNPTGSLSFTPASELSGTAVITVTVTDDGATGGDNVNTFQRSFTITVNPVNDEPTLDAIADPAPIDEDAPQQTVNLSGISAGGGETQNLTVTASSSNPGLVADPAVTYTSDNPTGSLSYTPIANQSGTAVITVTVTDDGGTANGGDNTVERSFTVTVNAVNDAPTLNAIGDRMIDEDAPQQTVNLAGISAGGGETQNLTVTAVSSDPVLIANPTVNYTSPAGTGSLNFTPTANLFGTAVITVTVTDDGATGGDNVNTFQRSFTVTVKAVNDEPTLDPIADPAPIDEDASQQTVTITGISAGLNESQNLTVTASSDNPGLIPNPGVTYSSPNGSGSLSYTPVTDASGTAVITVTVTDDGGTTNGGDNSIQRSFTVTVNAVNDAPEIHVSSPAVYIEGDPATVLDATATISDVDNNSLTSVTASITGNFDNGHDFLGATGSATVQVAVTPNGQSVVLTAAAGQSPTVADFQAVLQTLTYVNTEVVPSNNANRTVTVTADDGTGTPTAVGTTTFDIEIVPPVLPFARNDSRAVLEDSGTTTFDVLANDRFSNDTMNPTITGVTQPPNGEGTVSINGTQVDYSTGANFSGTTTFTYVIDDDDPATTDGPSTGTVTVTVNGVNDAPTLDAIDDLTFDEDEPNAALRTTTLSGISSGPQESQTLTFSATSNNTSLIPDANISFNYTSGSSGTVTVTPTPDRPLGPNPETAVITVVLSDNGGTANGGQDSTTQSFTVTVNPVNDPPTIDQVVDQIVLEDSGGHSVPLTGVTAGGGESQTLDVSASQSGDAVITNLQIAGSTLSYETVADQFGVATISVVVQDAGLDNTLGNGDDAFTTMSFDVTVTAVNDAPTLAPIADPTAILEDAGQQTVNLSGIGAGGGETQNLTVTATSSNPGLIPSPTVNYSSAAATGSLDYTPVGNQNGTAVITVVVTDDGGTADGGVNSTTQQFTVTVTPVNDAPTLAPIDDQQVAEGAPQQSITLTGISAGPSNETQDLTVTAVSNLPGVVGNPTIIYNSADETAVLQYTPVPNQNGTATITVTVMDNGGTDNGGVDSFEQTFNISVLPVNDAPTLDPIDNVAVAEDSGAGNVTLTGITAGPNETQFLNVTATSSNPALIPNPVVTYTSDNPTGSLQFTPVGDKNGSAVITVKVMDDGGTLVGGVDTFTQTFTITVTEVNDAPTANNDSGVTGLTTSEDMSLTIASATLTANDVTGPPTATDELANQTLTITQLNPGSGTPTQTAHGTISLSPITGVITYTPAANYNGTDTFTYVVQDDGTTNGANDFKSATATATITITAVNDAPIITAPTSDSTLEDAPATISLATLTSNAVPGPNAPSGTVDDETGQSLEVFAVGGAGTSGSSANNGAVSIVGGNIVYTPAADFNGADSFTYLMRDDGQTNGAADPQTVTGTVNISVTAVNDAPNTFDRLNLIGISNGGPQVYDPLGGPMPDTPGPENESGQTLTLIDVTLNTAGAGTLAVNSDGRTFTYTPAPDFESDVGGIVNITYTVQDDGGTDNGGVDTATGTVEIDVKKFLPTKFSGYIYQDTNSNNLKEAGEAGLAGVTVTLEGDEQFGSHVVRTVTTSADGYYEFTDVRPGQFDVFLEAIPFLNDGADTIYTPGTPTPGFNQFSVTHAGLDRVHLQIELLGGHELRTDFAKLGLQSQFYSLWDILASSGSENILFGIDPTGSLLWCQFGDGWDGFVRADFQLSSSGDSATLTLVYQNADNTQSTTVINLDSTQFRIKGTTTEGSVIQLLGSASDFGLAALQTPEGELPEDAAEALQAVPLEGETVISDEQLVAQLPQGWQSTDVQALAPPTLTQMLAALLPPAEGGHDLPPADAEPAPDDQQPWDEGDYVAMRARQIAEDFGHAPSDGGTEFVEALDAIFSEGFDLLS